MVLTSESGNPITFSISTFRSPFSVPFITCNFSSNKSEDLARFYCLHFFVPSVLDTFSTLELNGETKHVNRTFHNIQQNIDARNVVGAVQSDDTLTTGDWAHDSMSVTTVAHAGCDILYSRKTNISNHPQALLNYVPHYLLQINSNTVKTFFLGNRVNWDNVNRELPVCFQMYLY